MSAMDPPYVGKIALNFFSELISNDIGYTKLIIIKHPMIFKQPDFLSFPVGLRPPYNLKKSEKCAISSNHMK